MTSEKKMDDSKSDACINLLSNMLLRIEDEKEGFIREMINGVESDRNSTPDNIADKSHIDQVFMHALKILNRCENLKKSSSVSSCPQIF